MLFDIGWQELLLIGVIALVVIGPKDLPAALRVAGVWMRKARVLSREFQKTIDPTGELAQSIKPPEIPDFFDAPPLPLPEPAQNQAPITAVPEMTTDSDLKALPPPDDEPMLPGFELPPVVEPASLHELSVERSSEPSKS